MVHYHPITLEAMTPEVRLAVVGLDMTPVTGMTGLIEWTGWVRVEEVLGVLIGRMVDC